MSRPDSPFKANTSAEDTCKKLKVLLIKEKKINKDNEKIINELKAENDKQCIENNLLIEQIRRLSDRIGNMGEDENEKLKELDNLKETITELNLEIKLIKTEEEAKFKDIIDNFTNQVRCYFNSFKDVNAEFLPNKLELNECDTLSKVSDDIFRVFEVLKSTLKSQCDVNNVLQDGLDKITCKCNNLESLIESKDERIKSLGSDEARFNNIMCELNQKEEQIKRLEELIEDNRNISRALETERDQLQNDLMDLRQRHEEKEGYLIEEYREAQQSLENYRIFTDKQSAEKGNEIERLRNCLDEYQRTTTQVSFLPECGLCREIDSLFAKLKQEFDIDEMIVNHDDIVTSIIEKFSTAKCVSDRSLEEFLRNDLKCRREIDILSKKIDSLETELQERKFKHASSEMELIKDLNKKVLIKEEELYSLRKELVQIKSFNAEIQELLDCEDSSMIIDTIKQSLSLCEELEAWKSFNKEQIIQLEHSLHEKDNRILELTEKLTDAGKHVSSNDLMSLEMAEIDRTLVNLNSQLATKSSKLTELESSLGVLTKKNQSLEKQNLVVEERNNKIKQMLIKTKRELTDYKTQASSLQEKETMYVTEVELLTTQLEDTKVLLSEAVNDKERLQERYNTYSKKMDAVTKNREMTINSLRSQLDGTIKNYKCLQQEFDLYKIKVQTAFNTKLRSPSTFSDFMTISTNESANNEEISVKSFNKQLSDLEMKIDDLKIDSREKDDKIFSLNSDLDLMRWENEKLSEKYRHTVKENHDLTVKMQQVIDQLQTDTKLHHLSHSDMMEKFKLEKEKLNTMHQNQIESVRSEYELEIESLNRKLEEKEKDNIKIQEEVWDCREQLKSADSRLGQMKLGTNDQSRSSINDIWSKQFKSPFGQERQQGEGMEMNSEVENAGIPIHNKIASPMMLTKSAAYNNTFVSLGQLLSSHIDDEQKVTEDTIQALRADATSYKKKNEHLTELLNDTEETVARLTDQAQLLKAEIRRLEKNEERERTLEDTASREYLKNVIVKFLRLDTGADERGQLVPVIGTLLSLDEGERALLARSSRGVARGEGEGWGSYFGWAGPV